MPRDPRVCPIDSCGEPVAYVALQPMVEGDKVIDPHSYYVCSAHYKKQWEAVNGGSYETYAQEKDYAGRNRGVQD